MPSALSALLQPNSETLQSNSSCRLCPEHEWGMFQENKRTYGLFSSGRWVLDTKQDLVSLDLAPTWVNPAAWNIPICLGFFFFSFFLFIFPAWRALWHGNSNAERSKAEKNSQWIYLVSTPSRVPPSPAHRFFREQCCVWSGNNKKVTVFFSFYKRWFIIAVQLFFQLELKFIMVGLGVFFCSHPFLRGHQYIEYLNTEEHWCIQTFLSLFYRYRWLTNSL